MHIIPPPPCQGENIRFMRFWSMKIRTHLGVNILRNLVIVIIVFRSQNSTSNVVSNNLPVDSVATVQITEPDGTVTELPANIIRVQYCELDSSINSREFLDGEPPLKRAKINELSHGEQNAADGETSQNVSLKFHVLPSILIYD